MPDRSGRNFRNRSIVLVDGVQIGGDNYTDVPHGLFATQAFTFQGNFGPGPHTVFVSPQTGTALAAFFIDSITYQGLTTKIDTAVQETGQFITVQPPRAVLTGSMVTGPAEGSAILNGTSGADTIVAQGGDNTINGLGGNDTITGSTVGSDTINLVATSDTTATQDKVILSGANNVVTANTASVAVSGSAINSTLNLGLGNNTVQLDGAGNIVLLRTGTNTITATGGNAFVRVGVGYPDTSSYMANITLSGTGNQVSASGYFKPSGGGTLSVTGGTGDSTFFSGAGKTTIVTGGSANTFNIAGGTFDITTGSSSANVTITTGGNIYQGSKAVGTVRLSGSSNIVTAGYSNTTIVGGSGDGTFNLGNTTSGTYTGAFTLTTDGTNNTVNLTAAGQSTIDPGSGSDTISITGRGSQSVIFRGSGDMLFLHPIAGPSANEGGATATVSDQSTNLQVFIDPYLNSLTLTQFGAAGVLHLLNGAGEFTSAAAAAAAITPDAGGGTMLVLNQPYSPGPGNGLNPMGAIHFAAGEHITAANFSIG